MGRPTVNEAEAGARASDERAVITRLAWDGRKTAGQLEQGASAAAEWLADPRTSAPPLAGVRAQMLTALVAAGAVANRVEER